MVEGPSIEPENMGGGWRDLPSSLKPSRRSNTTFYTMRHNALTLPAPANRAYLFAAHGTRSREEKRLLDGHFAIDRLGRDEG